MLNYPPVVCRQAQLLIRIEGLSLKTQILNALSERFCDVEFVSYVFSNVKVVGRNVFVD